MYIPSGPIFKLIESARVGVWAESYSEGNRSALLAKAPTTTIKAVLQGCDVQLIVGVCTPKKTYLALALMIFDSGNEPLLLCTAPRTQREIDGLVNLLRQKVFSFTFYDEFGSPACYGEGLIGNETDNTLQTHADISDFHPVENIVTANEVIDSFCYSIDPAYGTSGSHESTAERYPLTLTKVNSMHILSITEFGSIDYQVDSLEEGETQEKQLAHFLAYNFGDSVYHSPQVRRGTRFRELTDVLAFDERCNYCIESKALSINASGYEKSTQRRISSAIKHSQKALDQLEGCIKAIRNGEPIATREGESLQLENVSQMHGIAIISEFIPSERWDEIICKIVTLSKSNDACFHVIGLSEFIHLIRLSQRPTISFEQCLVERFNAVLEHKTLHINEIDSSLPFSPQEDF